MLSNLRGIIFPDIAATAIHFGLFNSQADMLLQVTRDKYPDAKGDQPIFRQMRQFEKSWGKESYPREEIKNLLRLYKRKKMFDNLAWKPTFSDLKFSGNWFSVKSRFIEYRSSKDNSELQVLIDYVDELCSRDKANIKLLYKQASLLEIVETIQQEFLLPETLLSEVYEIIELSDTEQTALKNIPVKFWAKYLIHQYLLLAAILEHELYAFYIDNVSQEQLEGRAMITRLLPTVDKYGNYVGSVKRMITHIYKTAGYTSQQSFAESLCNNSIDGGETIHRNLNKWKSGALTITPKKLNELLERQCSGHKEVVPADLVFACVFADKLSRELIDSGHTPAWIASVFNDYPRYQSMVRDEVNMRLRIHAS